MSTPTSIEFREDGELRMVSLVDRLVDGLSSVYTFFDPEPPAASYGTYNILWQIELCRELGLPYLYLGLLDRREPKMAYKATFRPIEGMVGGRWIGSCSASDLLRRFVVHNDKHACWSARGGRNFRTLA